LRGKDVASAGPALPTAGGLPLVVGSEPCISEAGRSRLFNGEAYRHRCRQRRVRRR